LPLLLQIQQQQQQKCKPPITLVKEDAAGAAGAETVETKDAARDVANPDPTASNMAMKATQAQYALKWLPIPLTPLL
jgi:hypothetical protein